MGLTSFFFTCLISSITSERAEVLCSVLFSWQQRLRKKEEIAKKFILFLRAIMISQKVDLVANDFKGIAWRYLSKDNFSTIDEAFTDCALHTHHCGNLDPFRRIGQTFADFSNHFALNLFGK